MLNCIILFKNHMLAKRLIVNLCQLACKFVTLQNAEFTFYTKCLFRTEMKCTVPFTGTTAFRFPQSAFIKHLLQYENSYNRIVTKDPSCSALILQIQELLSCTAHCLLAPNHFLSSSQSLGKSNNTPPPSNFIETRRFITVFTTAHHLFLSCCYPTTTKTRQTH